MIVIQNTNCIFFDCDDTLVMWGSKYQNEDKSNCVVVNDGIISEFLTPHDEHIRYLKACKQFNKMSVIVWSAGGWNWAKAVVEALNLTDYVDAVMAKPEKYVDDLHCSKFMGEMVYKNFKQYEAAK